MPRNQSKRRIITHKTTKEVVVHQHVQPVMVTETPSEPGTARFNIHLSGREIVNILCLTYFGRLLYLWLCR